MTADCFGGWGRVGRGGVRNTPKFVVVIVVVVGPFFGAGLRQRLRRRFDDGTVKVTGKVSVKFTEKGQAPCRSRALTFTVTFTVAVVETSSKALP